MDTRKFSEIHKFYDFEKKIGEGSTSSVFLAHLKLLGPSAKVLSNLNSNGKVAIKVVSKKDIDKSEFPRIMVEFKILKKIKNPKIIKLYDVTTIGVIYIDVRDA